MAKRRESVSGEVLRIRAERRNANGTRWFAGTLEAGDGQRVSFTATGDAAEGDEVTLYGEWVETAQYGRQFKAGGLSLCMPVDAAGLMRWLERNVFRVGPVAARRLVAAFGTELPALCASDPARVAADGEIGEDAVRAIAAAWEKNGGRLAAMTWLMGPAELTERLAANAIDCFGESVVRTIQNDPFQLLGRATGFGWKTTDELAARLGILGTDRRRLRGAVAAVVREKRDGDGWTCVGAADAVSWAKRKADAPADAYATAVADAVAARDLAFAADDVLAVPESVRAESAVWAVLIRSREPNPLGFASEAAARQVAERHRTSGSITFTDEQMRVVVNALRYRISVVTGIAGAGKTAMTQAIVDIFKELDVPVLLAAPTGKAARRITELIGQPAQTIHRLLEFHGGTGQFRRNAKDPLESGVVVVDEASMLCAPMSHSLLSAVGPRGAVVLVGDPNQLPPVGAGAVLRDILAHDLAPVTALRTCHRQAGPLKLNSVAILDGKVSPCVPPQGDQLHPPWEVRADAGTPEAVYKFLAELYAVHLPAWKFDPVRDTQFMSAIKNGPYGVKQLNLLLQHLHQTAIGNPIPAPAVGAGAADFTPPVFVGDKVIQTRNDYTLDVMNGESGIVSAKDLTLRDWAELVDVHPDPATPPETHMVAPITADAEGRRTAVCPVCLAPAPVTAGRGWETLTCRSCGVEFAATDGTPRPVGVPPPGRRQRRAGESPVFAYAVDFPDRRVGYPVGMAGDLQLGYCLSVHKCVHPDTLVETEEGLLPIRLVADAGVIASQDGPKFYRAKVSNPVASALRITTKRGRQITVTPDHGVEVWTGEGYERREASQLCIGDWVRSRLGVTLEPSSPATLPDLPAGDVRAAGHRVPREVTPDVAEFFGLMVADGTVFDRGFRLLKRHKDVAERFGNLCRTIFDCDPRSVKSEDGGVTGYEVSSTRLGAWLSLIGGMSPNRKGIPQCVLRSTSSLQADFLRGLFEDGTVNERDGACDHIEYTTVYESVARTVQVMLARLGVISSLKYYPPRSKPVGNRSNAHYRIYIYGAECAAYRDRVGFVSEFKQSRLENCLTSAVKYSMPVSREEADSLAVLGKSTLGNARFTRTVSRETATRAGWRHRLNWFDDRIATIDPVECESMCVEVPNGHRFLQNGFPWWNCQGSQFPCAVTVVPRAHSYSQTRNWFYTGVTRASRTAVIVGDTAGILGAARNSRTDDRETILRLYATRPETRPAPLPAAAPEPAPPADAEGDVYSLTANDW